MSNGVGNKQVLARGAEAHVKKRIIKDHGRIAYAGKRVVERCRGELAAVNFNCARSERTSAGRRNRR